MKSRAVSNKTIRLFMSVLVSESQRTDSKVISLQSGAVADLRKRKDFNAVLRVLEGLEYCKILWADCNIPINLHFTNKGLTFFETDKDIQSEHRWTRGLAITSIVISALSLLLACVSLYLQVQ